MNTVSSTHQLCHICAQEHPVLGTPFYMLHPCETSARMALLMGSSSVSTDDKNYLMSWFSLIGPAVHLPMPLSVAQALLQGPP